jgi:hypothetical protein
VTHAADPSGWRANPPDDESVVSAVEATAAVAGRPADSLARETSE